jgi:signal recognition particle subunit SEC65
MPHAFISYVRDDEVEVKKLADELEKLGVEVWLDRNKIYPGMPWKRAIRKAIEDGNYFIACFSKAFTARSTSTMNEELNLAIDQIRKRHDDASFFIPLLIDASEMPDWDIRSGKTLRDYHYVELYKDWSKGINDIAFAIREDDKKKRRTTSSSAPSS